MPRIPRGQVGGSAYHVINRGNRGAVVFHKDEDYASFIDLLSQAKSKYAVKIFGFCLMPNHFHVVLEPSANQAISVLMQWWLTSHVRRYHKHYQSNGHVWQGRFKSFPIQQDEHFLIVLRYIMRNPVRAGMVQKTYQWPWSSIQQNGIIDPWPVPPPPDWERWIETPLFNHELDRLRTCVNRQAPFGSPEWQEKQGREHGLESTLRSRGRPPKTEK